MKKMMAVLLAIVCGALFCAMVLSCGEKDEKENLPDVDGKGNWIWTIIDDSATKKWAPGISTINFIEGDVDPESETGEKYRVPETKEDSGQTVFHFEGTTKQKEGVTKDNYKEGAGWPLVGWTAKPADEATEELLQSAYGYSFYIRINKSCKTYQTSVDNSYYQVDEGHEPVYWFGPELGGDAYVDNYLKVEVGKWKKITVIYDPDHKDYNIDYAKWIYLYGVNVPPLDPYPNDKPDGSGVKEGSQKDAEWPPFDKSKALNIKWQIQLQHNGGVQFDAGEYSMGSNSVPHDFNVDFYGLDLLVDE